MKIQVRKITVHVLNMHTRMPFRYGIATLTALPHLFMELVLDVDGRVAHGVSAEGFPPKWFTKDPQATFRQEVEQMICVLQNATDAARQTVSTEGLFDWWYQVYERQRAWAGDQPYPSLLWSFGVTMVERAAISAFCHLRQTSFANLLRQNALGIELGRVHRNLAGADPAQLLADRPSRQINLRHTVGLIDPLTDADIPENERLDDGLPQSLEACIRTYGLTYFKIKLCGDLDQDRLRLQQLAAVITRNTNRFHFTLDGNEQFEDMASFRELWNALHTEKSLDEFWPGLLFVEQPIHRRAALNAAQRRAFEQWTDCPPMIIDESDADLDSMPTAVDLGYHGTSHKNCKGVFKSIINSCHMADLRRQNGKRLYVLSAEDLCTVGPVALTQDIAVAATLGIQHIERNGHHYMAGTSMLPEDLQEQVLACHPDLYRRHDQGFATLDIRDGILQIGSLIDAPFGIGFQFDTTRFTPLDEWRFDSLDDS